MEKTESQLFPDPVSLRIATAQDAELIADLSRATFFDTFYAYNDPRNMNLFLEKQFTRESLIAEVSVETNRFVVAHCGDEVAGYMKLRDGFRPEELGAESSLEIARLYATSNMIGRGVGKALMQYAHEAAREKERQALWLAVWEKNTRALEFYRRWGFEIVGKQVFILGLDLQTDWIMKKAL